MQRIRLLFSLLCAVCALVVALVKPLSTRADDTTPAPAPPAPTPVDVNPVIPPLPVIRPKPARKTQLHLPFGNRVVEFDKHLLGTRYAWCFSTATSGFYCYGILR